MMNVKKKLLLSPLPSFPSLLLSFAHSPPIIPVIIQQVPRDNPASLLVILILIIQLVIVAVVGVLLGVA